MNFDDIPIEYETIDKKTGRKIEDPDEIYC